MRHDQGRFHLAERALGDIVGSLPQNFLTIFPKQAESHEAPRIDAGGAGFLGLAIYKCNVGADLWGIRPAKGEDWPKVMPSVGINRVTAVTALS